MRLRARALLHSSQKTCPPSPIFESAADFQGDSFHQNANSTDTDPMALDVRKPKLTEA